jgi:membrane fusion protein (multidrug efflux system)
MPQVTGTVVSIDADETDLVSAGQELIRLDPTDLRIALQDAEQQLARTVRQTRTVFANRDQLLAVVGQRRSDLTRAESVSTGARTWPPPARYPARNWGTRAMP